MLAWREIANACCSAPHWSLHRDSVTGFGKAERLLDRIEVSAERADQTAHLINNPSGLKDTFYLARENG